MNHMSDIGFEPRSPEELKAIGTYAVQHGKLFVTPEGPYWFWKTGDIELWPWANRKEELGINPHFAGTSRRKIKLTGKVPGSGLDGKYHALMTEEVEGDIEYSFIIDVPNFYLDPITTFPVDVTAQITAFAEELSYFDTTEEQKEKGVGLATQAFIPTGTHPSSGEKKDPVRAEAVLSGKIIKVGDVKNGFTDKRFFHLLVETLSTEIDIVADKRYFSKDPQVGGYVEGSFWLSAKINPDDPPYF